MHGLIFFYIQKFANEASAGTTSWQSLRSSVTTSAAKFLPSNVYPDADALHLLESISRSAGKPLPALRILLPIGISFYTFAGISYAVDVYRGMIKPAKSVIHYLAWVTLFPYILAGPIIRYGHVGAQLEHSQQRFRWSLIGTGLFFMIMGLAKKMLVADMMAPYVNTLFSHYTHLGLLSGWLRDYLFIPLGGSRGTTLFTVRNLLITFLLGGLWHGPAWTFVFWGLLWGVYQSVHVVAKRYGFTPKWVWLNRLLTFVAATVAWVFFRASSLRAAGDVLASMVGLHGVSGAGTLRLVPILAAFIVGGLLWVNLLPNSWEIKASPKLRYALILGLLLAVSLLAMSKPSAFLYVQF